jgi:type IV secretion system protein VirD4
MDNSLGDARTNSEAEIGARLETGESSGVYLNFYYDRETELATRELRYHGDRHLLLFGPTGSGKTTRFLIPNLLLALEDRSVIVIDPKGELAAITASHRRSLGHDVVILNPFGVRGFGSEGFNPLAGLDATAATFYDDAAAIGEALIKVEGSEPHWSESAQGLVVGLIMWEVQLAQREGRAPLLDNVRHMLTEPNESETGPDGKRVLTKGLRVTAARAAEKGGFEIESLTGRFVRETDEIASIQSTADTQTRWLLSRPMRDDLAKNGIDFAHLKARPTTVYVILPAERLRTHSVWLRLVIVSALRSLYQPGGLRTMLFVDEMAALGHLGPLEDAFGLVRGYNIQIAAILQDLSQLKALYKERWETFVANAGVVFGFAPNDLTTAEWMSKRSGQMTVSAMGFSTNTGSTAGEKTSTSAGMGASYQQIARPLFLPHELIGLEEGMGIMWLAGLANSTPTYAPYYRKIKLCRERAPPEM